MAFHESSLCICITKTVNDWKLDHASITAELGRRNKDHQAIINNTHASPVHDILKEIQKYSGKSLYGKFSASYVFSFYILEKNEDDQIDKYQIMKLIEPSTIDMDDMLSTDTTPANTRTTIKQNAIDSIKDVDISNSSETYISWATILSLSAPGEATQKNINLLTALEMRLQIVWNRCYSVSQYIEKVFAGENMAKDINELFWSFSRTLDDAKSVLSSTFSSRSESLFHEMIKTSKIEGEISRLEQKVILLEKYIDQRNTLQSKKYQKTIELLLFITAIASLSQVFFPVPISIFNEGIELGIVAAITLLGIYAIFKSK